MRTRHTTVAAGVGVAALLGAGLYLAVPALAADPSPSASPKAEPKHPRWDRPGENGPSRRGHGLRGHRWGGHGVHGEATVQRDDGFRLATWQRGEITALSSATLTVKSADGVSWTWTTNADTRVRKDREKAAVKDLADGDKIIVVGERSGDTRTAKVIRVRKAD
ncbi:DUF5666 domain-containing protein [Spirillospora sp. NPDC048819]|uniref:DUF5666 domain-containing protein n=1 Tax=Spirillospora sp. NPDC048819 TaxID=3155268 RepID=UPI0033C3B542